MNEPAPPSHPPRGHSFLAWIVIVGGCAFVIWRNVKGTGASDVPALTIDATRPSPLLLLAGAGMLLIALTGLGLLVLWAVLVGLGRLRLRLRAYPHYGGIYAETFALWMLLYMGLGYAVARFDTGRPQLLVAGIASFLSLAALAWPVVRGVRWWRVLHDVGLHPRNVDGWDVVYGLACYAVALALAFAGLMVTLLLMQLQRKLGPDTTPVTPYHPATEWIVRGDWWVRLQVVFVAVVVAPVVEETMFRGVLYRHLREAGYRGGKVLSIGAGTVVTSFVFAAIHPQGWLGVPPLMGLAAAFTLAREWRGTLLPAMTAHAVNNFVATLLTLVIYG
jgi:membrane protease YdiL (CAAX protease family)